MRELRDSFVEDLQTGNLSELLKTVKTDETLCLEIRENYINIYYRGGNILRVAEGNERYVFHFDQRYCIDNSGLWETLDTSRLTSLEDYLENLPFIKREMDNWFAQNPKVEREFQQLILRENNMSPISGDTDYFVSDIEYANSENKSRFDMTGIKWLSNSEGRKNTNAPNLSIFEVKYGDGAMTGSAGIVKHFADIEKFIDSGKLHDLRKEVETQFNQKVRLGLMGGMSRAIQINREARPEFIMICANHKPASSIMKRELQKALVEYPELTDKIDVKIAKSSLMGYGLYSVNMIPIKMFLEEY